MNDLRPKRKNWRSTSLAAAALAALVLPLAFTTASATSQEGGYFGIKAADETDARITSTVGNLKLPTDDGGGEVTPPTEPEPSANSFVFTVNTDLCTDPKLYFEGIGAGTTVKDPSGDLKDLTEGWNSTPETGKWIIEGSFTKIGPDTPDPTAADCLLTVDSWGETGTTNAGRAFYGADNLTSVATPPSSITDTGYMFAETQKFNSDFFDWDTSNITNMGGMFAGASAFNGNISNWDVRNVTNTGSMFHGASSFSGDLSSWRTDSLQVMEQMFNGAKKFNSDISGWNVSNVMSLKQVFQSAESFNQDISRWNTSKVINMEATFGGAVAFNKPLAGWDTSNVTNMRQMFNFAIAFNQPLDSWTTSKVTNMEAMFSGAAAFNQDLPNWKTSNVTTMRQMFFNARGFNGNIAGWNVSNVVGASGVDQTFMGASSFSGNLSQWKFCKVGSKPFPFTFVPGGYDTAKLPTWKCS